MSLSSSWTAAGLMDRPTRGRFYGARRLDITVLGASSQRYMPEPVVFANRDRSLSTWMRKPLRSPHRIRVMNYEALRVARVIATASCLLVAYSGSASAAVWLIVEPDSGAPGETVQVRTIGDGAMAASAPGDSLPLYVSGTPSQQGSASTDLTLVGALTVDSSHNARGSFVVPSVRPGRYQLVMRCDTCGPTSAGRTLLPVGEFTVTTTVPRTDTERSDGVSLFPLMFVSMALGLTIVLLQMIAKRSRR